MSFQWGCDWFQTGKFQSYVRFHVQSFPFLCFQLCKCICTYMYVYMYCVCVCVCVVVVLRIMAGTSVMGIQTICGAKHASFFSYWTPTSVICLRQVCENYPPLVTEAWYRYLQCGPWSWKDSCSTHIVSLVLGNTTWIACKSILHALKFFSNHLMNFFGWHKQEVIRSYDTVKFLVVEVAVLQFFVCTVFTLSWILKNEIFSWQDRV